MVDHIGGFAPKPPLNAGPSFRFAVVALAFVVVGCNKSEAATGHAKTGETAPPPAAAATAAVPKAETETYAVEMKSPAACKAGAECTVEVSVTPKAGYHINAQYPYKLKMADPAPEGVAWSKAVLVRADGTFEEKKGSFKVGFTPSKAGSPAIRGTLSFSVCSEANCIMDRQDLEVPVEVK